MIFIPQGPSRMTSPISRVPSMTSRTLNFRDHAEHDVDVSQRQVRIENEDWTSSFSREDRPCSTLSRICPPPLPLVIAIVLLPFPLPCLPLYEYSAECFKVGDDDVPDQAPFVSAAMGRESLRMLLHRWPRRSSSSSLVKMVWPSKTMMLRWCSIVSSLVPAGKTTIFFNSLSCPQPLPGRSGGPLHL